MLILPFSKIAKIGAVGVVHPPVVAGVLLPLLEAVSKWLLLDTSRILSVAVSLEDYDEDER
jgi:hypothetical protein